MTRLGHQGLTLSRAWISIDELIGSATQRLKRYQPNIQIDTNIAPNLPALYVHPALIEQALFNVLENAAKFSPDAVPIQVKISAVDEQFQIDIIDLGIGIPEQEREQILICFIPCSVVIAVKLVLGLGLPS